MRCSLPSMSKITYSIFGKAMLRYVRKLVLATMDTRKTETISSSFSSPSPYRRRRMIWCFILVFTTVFFFGAPWEMPGYLKDLDHSLGFSRANIVKLVRPPPPSGSPRKVVVVDEIYGLLHLVTRTDGRELEHDTGVVSNRAMDMGMYDSEGEVNWDEEVKELNEKYPLVIFSKVSI